VVAKRYKVSIRTVDRWLRDPNLNFPKAIKIRDRNYFREIELDAFDKAQAEVSKNQNREVK